MAHDRRLQPGNAGAGSPELIVGGIFQGYNSFLDQAELPALTGVTKKVSGPTQLASVTICASFNEYLQSINVDSSVSYGSLGSSASAKLSYAYDLNVTEQAVYFTVYASKTEATTQADSVSLLRGVAVPSTQAESEQFFTSYGDSWVDLVTTGAEYIATYTFYCQTVAESQSVQTSLAAKNVTLSATMDGDLTEVSSETDVRVEISQFLRGVSLPMPSDPSDIWDFATSTFMAATPDGATVIDYSVQPYEKVPALYPFEPIASTRDLFSGTAASPNVSEQLCQLQSLYGQVTDIQNVYGRYGYSGDSLLPQRAAQIAADLQDVTNLVNEMGTDPTQAYTAPEPESLTYGTPSLSYQLQYSDPSWGGTGGGPFNDVVDGLCPAFVESGWAITSITLAGNGWMNLIQVTYTALDGSWVQIQHGDYQTAEVIKESRVISQPAGAAAQATQATSPAGFSYSSPLTLNPPGDVITSIWAMWGNYLNQLKISTTSSPNQLVWPPNPQEAVNTDTWGAADNRMLLAFRGRVGEYVDQLQLITLTFSPATWAQPTTSPDDERSDGTH